MKIDYYAYQSGMREWNAAFKVFTALATLCMVIFLNRIAASLFVIVSMGVLTLFVGEIPYKVYFRYLLLPLSFMIFSCVVIAVSVGGKPVGEWNVLYGGEPADSGGSIF